MDLVFGILLASKSVDFSENIRAVLYTVILSEVIRCIKGICSNLLGVVNGINGVGYINIASCLSGLQQSVQCGFFI